MRGIKLSQAYYNEYGLPMLNDMFKDKLDRIAVGLVGHGSECFGFDDDISVDHDYTPGFCIWLTDEDEKEFGFKLFRAYSKLPKEFHGVRCSKKSLYGSDGRGIMTIKGFYRNYTGRDGAPEGWRDWLYTPSHFFAEATNGCVFCDPVGEFTRIRNIIKYGMPEDVRLKKIASCSFHMAQLGQYNYSRCIKHGEKGAARLALNGFADKCAEMVFLLEKEHAPYYKWIFKSMRNLKTYGGMADKLENLLTLPSDSIKEIESLIEEISSDIISAMGAQQLTNISSDYLEPHAYAVNDLITESEIRNLNIIL